MRGFQQLRTVHAKDYICKGVEVWGYTCSQSDVVERRPNPCFFHPDFLFALAPSPFQALRCDNRDAKFWGFFPKATIQVTHRYYYMTHSLSGQVSSDLTLFYFIALTPPKEYFFAYYLSPPTLSRTQAAWYWGTCLPCSFIPSTHLFL